MADARATATVSGDARIVAATGNARIRMITADLHESTPSRIVGRA
jgi:hypothetical protein